MGRSIMKEQTMVAIEVFCLSGTTDVVVVVIGGGIGFCCVFF